MGIKFYHLGSTIPDVNARLQGEVIGVPQGNHEGFDTILLAIDNKLGEDNTNKR